MHRYWEPCQCRHRSVKILMMGNIDCGGQNIFFPYDLLIAVIRTKNLPTCFEKLAIVVHIVDLTIFLKLHYIRKTPWLQSGEGIGLPILLICLILVWPDPEKL